jgi:hypothetical protein
MSAKNLNVCCVVRGSEMDLMHLGLQRWLDRMCLYLHALTTRALTLPASQWNSMKKEKNLESIPILTLIFALFIYCLSFVISLSIRTGLICLIKSDYSSWYILCIVNIVFSILLPFLLINRKIYSRGSKNSFLKFIIKEIFIWLVAYPLTVLLLVSVCNLASLQIDFSYLCLNLPWEATPSLTDYLMISITYSVSMLPFLLISFMIHIVDDLDILKKLVYILVYIHNWVKIETSGMPSLTHEPYRHGAGYYFLAILSALALLTPSIVYLTAQSVLEGYYSLNILNGHIRAPERPEVVHPSSYDIALWSAILFVGLLFLVSCSADMMGIIKGGLLWSIIVKPIGIPLLLGALPLMTSSFPHAAGGLLIVKLSLVVFYFPSIFGFAQLVVSVYGSTLRNEVLSSLQS